MTMKHTLKRMLRLVAAGLMGLGFLSACASPPPVPEDSFYRIAPVAENPGAQVLDGMVEVSRFSASGSLGNRPLLMSDRGSSAVNEYHYHFWIEQPPILLQTALVSYLRSSKVAKTVVTPELRVTPDYTVTGHVLRMETVRGTKPAGLVTFELSLRRESDGKILVLDEYTIEVPAAQDRVQDGAVAVEQAINQAFANFVADIRKLPL